MLKINAELCSAKNYGKKAKYTIQWIVQLYHEIFSHQIFFVKSVSRDFSQELLRVNFRHFHTVIFKHEEWFWRLKGTHTRNGNSVLKFTEKFTQWKNFRILQTEYWSKNSVKLTFAKYSKIWFHVCRKTFVKPWLTENSRLHSLSIHVKNIPRTWKMEKRAKKGLLAVICLCWFLKNLREEELSDASAFHSVEKRKFYSHLKIISWNQHTHRVVYIVISWIDFTELSKWQFWDFSFT